MQVKPERVIQFSKASPTSKTNLG